MQLAIQYFWLIWMMVINYLTYRIGAFDHEVNEELPLNYKFYNIKNDIIPDLTDYKLGDLQMSLPSDYFKIDKQGNILIKERIDLESLCNKDSICCDTPVCKLPATVYVTKKSSDFSKSYKYNFIIIDVNDNAPKFETPMEVVKIYENTRIGSFVKIEQAKDDDSTIHNQINRYTFTEPTRTFALENNDYFNLQLVIKKPIDYESNKLFKGNLTACDSGNLCASRSIHIVVKDRNDNYPEFVKKRYKLNVKEDVRVGKVLLTVKAIDKDSAPFNTTKYSIIKSRRGMSDYRLVTRTFSLNSLTGELKLKRRLNVKATQRYHFQISAVDSLDSSGQNRQLATVILTIIDVNDHAPEINLFEKSNVTVNSLNDISIKIYENEPKKKLLALRVSDDDINDNAKVSCQLMSNLDKLMIKIRDENVYELKTMRSFDYEMQKVVHTTITCRDNGRSRSQETNLRVTLQILDVNEYIPRFSDHNYEIKLAENKVPGEELMKITANDKDGSAVIRYKIKELYKHRYFVINETTGQLRTGMQNYDREETRSDKFTVVVTDALYATINTIEQIVTVIIQDINDNKPVFQQDSLRFTIKENSRQKTKLNGQLKANDDDVDEKNHYITFKLIKTISWNNTVINPIFKLNPSGFIYTIHKIDREVNPNFTLIVVARDQGNPVLTTTATISIDVLDENDNAPVWRTPIISRDSRLQGFNISEYESEGTVIMHLQAYDPDLGDAGRIHYYIDNSDRFKDIFHLNSTSGLLTTAKSPLPINNYRLRLIATDLGRPPHKTDLYFDVNVTSKHFSEWNLVIIIGMIVVTLIIAMFLIIGIICVKRRPNIMAMNSENYIDASNMGTLKDGTNHSNILYPSPHFLNDDTASIATNQNFAGSPLATTGFLAADPNNSAYLYIPNAQNYYITSSQLDLNNISSRFPIGPSAMASGSLKLYESVNGDNGSQTGISSTNQQAQLISSGIQTPNNLNSNIEIIPNSSSVLYRNNQNRAQFLPTNQHIVYTTSPGSSYQGTNNNNGASGSPEYVVGGDGESADSGKGASEIDFQRLQHHQHQMQLQQLQMQHNFMTGRNFTHSSSTLPHNTHLYKNPHPLQLQPSNEPNYQTLTPYTYNNTNNPHSPRNAHHPDILSSSTLSLTGQQTPQQQNQHDSSNSKFITNETTPLNKSVRGRVSQNFINMLPEYDDDSNNIVPMTTFSTSYTNNNANTLTSNNAQFSEVTHINE